MNVQMTCVCGRRQVVPIELAGKTTPCAGCGQPLSVPALGVAVPSGRKRPAAVLPVGEASPFALATLAPPKHKAPHGISSQWATGLLMVICGLTLLLAAGVGAMLLGLHEPLLNLVRVAQVEPPPAPKENTPVPPDPVPAELPRQPPAEPLPPSNKPAELPSLPADPTVGKPLDKEPVVARPVVEEKPAVPVVEVKRPFKEGDTFLQDLLFTQKSRFVVQGFPAATMLQYRIASRYTVQKVQADGTLTVQQKIDASELTLADDLTQGLLADPVARLPGTTFTLELSSRGEVTKIGGAAGAMRFGGAKLPGGLGVQMASLLDADGWKEMAQATFYQPEQLDKPGQWTRPLTHNWGPLGGWVGKITYAYPGPGKVSQVKIPYALKIAYQPPKGPGAPGALPFQIAGGNFQPPQAGGALLYDTERGKVIAADERFHVRGMLALMLLGQNTPTEIEEEQVFQMRIAEK